MSLFLKVRAAARRLWDRFFIEDYRRGRHWVDGTEHGHTAEFEVVQ